MRVFVHTCILPWFVCTSCLAWKQAASKPSSTSHFQLTAPTLKFVIERFRLVGYLAREQDWWKDETSYCHAAVRRLFPLKRVPPCMCIHVFISVIARILLGLVRTLCFWAVLLDVGGLVLLDVVLNGLDVCYRSGTGPDSALENHCANLTQALTLVIPMLADVALISSDMRTALGVFRMFTRYLTLFDANRSWW